MMYVVRRAFKSGGVRYNPGDIIEDIARVRRIKEKLSMRKIVIVTEQNFDEMNAYFTKKFGKTLRKEDATTSALVDTHEQQVAKVQAAKVNINKQVGKVTL